MTHLAQELIEDLHSKIHIRPPSAVADDISASKQLRSLLWTMAHECKFFDCSEVTQLAMSLAEKTQVAFEELDRVDERLVFLPAEWTWIEIEQPGFRDQPEQSLYRRNSRPAPRQQLVSRARMLQSLPDFDPRWTQRK
jgi:hypothetical protein